MNHLSKRFFIAESIILKTKSSQIFIANDKVEELSKALAEILEIDTTSLWISDLDGLWIYPFHFESFIVNVFCPSPNVAEKLIVKINSKSFLNELNRKCLEKNILYSWFKLSSFSSPKVHDTKGMKIFYCLHYRCIL